MGPLEFFSSRAECRRKRLEFFSSRAECWSKRLEFFFKPLECWRKPLEFFFKPLECWRKRPLEKHRAGFVNRRRDGKEFQAAGEVGGRAFFLEATPCKSRPAGRSSGSTR